MSGEARIGITGSGGFVGRKLIDHLEATGRIAVPLVADVANPSAVDAAFLAAGPLDAVLHLAAANERICAVDHDRAMRSNAVGSSFVAEAAAAAGAKRLVYFSTMHVYGEPAVDVLDETTVPAPRHPYGISKLAGEFLARAVGKRTSLVTTVLRISNSVGAPANDTHDRWTLVALDLCRQAHEKGALRLHSSGIARRDFVAIGDVFSAVDLLLSSPAEVVADEIFNVGSGEQVPIRQIADWVQAEFAALYGKELPLVVGDEPRAVRDIKFSIDKVARLGYKPRTDLRREIREILGFCERFAG